jgi:hypothetical protein
MQYIMSEGEAQYMDKYQGHFSRKMAEWAVSMMRKEDEKDETKLKPVQKTPVDDVMEILKSNGVEISEECAYDAMYLYHMAMADYYGRSIEDKEHVARFVEDTLCDPDGDPRMVLACFRAKCDVKGIPIQWERMI